MFSQTSNHLHIDNIPHSADVLLHSHLNLTSFTLSSFDLRTFPRRRETPSAPRAFIPAFYDPEQLSLWGLSCDIFTWPNSAGLSILNGFHIFSCDIDDDFMPALSRTPLRKLTIGEAAVNVHALVHLVASSKKTQSFRALSPCSNRIRNIVGPLPTLKIYSLEHRSAI
ncbi:hypothetical protein BD410DRAFT_365695 [Rickenella mellea]|uniref:Uncharacterized protein n=1 Tax=Rickenella mellea TaxID=50990 RepID=A0A4Y7PYN4_9AGAM|nr:hypothetical protein BD410DRAFT_365695 [Rickenella mellea]